MALSSAQKKGASGFHSHRRATTPRPPISSLGPFPELQTHAGAAGHVPKLLNLKSLELSSVPTTPQPLGCVTSQGKTPPCTLPLNQSLGPPPSFTPFFLLPPHPVNYQLWNHLLNAIYIKYRYFSCKKLYNFFLNSEKSLLRFQSLQNPSYNGMLSQLVLNQKALFGEKTLPWNDLSQASFGRLLVPWQNQ